MKKIKIEKTKKGYPALWEQGGGYTNTGEAQIIASSTGGPKKPVYIRRAGSLANGQHALIILEKNGFNEGSIFLVSRNFLKDLFNALMINNPTIRTTNAPNNLGP